MSATVRPIAGCRARSTSPVPPRAIGLTSVNPCGSREMVWPRDASRRMPGTSIPVAKLSFVTGVRRGRGIRFAAPGVNLARRHRRAKVGCDGRTCRHPGSSQSVAAWRPARTGPPDSDVPVRRTGRRSSVYLIGADQNEISWNRTVRAQIAQCVCIEVTSLPGSARGFGRNSRPRRTIRRVEVSLNPGRIRA